MTQNTVDSVAALQANTRSKLQQLRAETAATRAEAEQYYDREPYGHPLVNWLITQLEQLNRWLVSRGWASNGLKRS